MPRSFRAALLVWLVGCSRPAHVEAPSESDRPSPADVVAGHMPSLWIRSEAGSWKGVRWTAEDRLSLAEPGVMLDAEKARLVEAGWKVSQWSSRVDGATTVAGLVIQEEHLGWALRVHRRFHVTHITETLVRPAEGGAALPADWSEAPAGLQDFAIRADVQHAIADLDLPEGTP